MSDAPWTAERLHLRRTLALLGGKTKLVIRVQTNLGFCAKFADWDLVENSIVVKGRKKPLTIEQLGVRLSCLVPLEFGTGQQPRRVEIRDEVSV